MSKKSICISSPAALVALVLALLASSCKVSTIENIASSIGGRTPKGEMTERTYSFTDIQAITSFSGVKVHYTQTASATSVVVKAPADVLEASEIKMDGTTLTVSMQSGTNFRYTSDSQRLHAYVSAPSVAAFTAYSGSDIEASAPVAVSAQAVLSASAGASIDFAALTTARADFSATSGASIEVSALKCESIEVESTSGASVEVAGQCVEAELGATSGGSIEAKKFFAQRGQANAYSGGSVESAIRLVEINKGSGGSVSNNSNF